MSMCNEFDTITKHYNKELTQCYIKHIDLLAHSYAKDLDDFPNKVRKELYDFSSTLLDPKHLEEVSNFIAPNLFSNNIDTWIEDHIIELLLKMPRIWHYKRHR